MRAYNVFAGSAGGNCLDIENSANPYRFYGISGSDCAVGINLVKARGLEFHGASFWGNATAGVSVTGTHKDPDAYILFDGLQLGPPEPNEAMYLDQQNETVICAANCEFRDAGKNCAE